MQAEAASWTNFGLFWLQLGHSSSNCIFCLSFIAFSPFDFCLSIVLSRPPPPHPSYHKLFPSFSFFFPLFPFNFLKVEQRPKRANYNTLPSYDILIPTFRLRRCCKDFTAGWRRWSQGDLLEAVLTNSQQTAKVSLPIATQIRHLESTKTL